MAQDKYKEGVEFFFNTGSKHIFSNAEPSHASVIYEMFFKHAKNRVHIFCKNLNKEVFDRKNVLDALDIALKNNIEIKIYITESNPDAIEFVKKLKEYEIKIHTEAPELKIDGKPCNFAYMDNSAFRFEENDSEIKASASANRPELVKQLNLLFENKVEQSVA